MLCYRCGGTGKYMGNGMIMTDCTICDEYGNMIERVELKVDRKSSSYKKAIKDIMSLDPSISRVEAVKMFDNAHNEVWGQG